MALVLSARRRVAAAGASVLLAVALAIAVVGRGCDVREPGPERAVRSMIEASSAGDRRAVWRLLSPETQRRLEERAQRATDLVGSNLRYTALDLIAIGSSEDRPTPSEIEVIEQAGNRAVVEIRSSDGRARLELVRVDGQWRIDLPGYGDGP